MTLLTDLFLLFTQNLLFVHVLGFPSMLRMTQRGRGLLPMGLLTVLFCTADMPVLAAVYPYLPQQYAALLLPLCCALLNGLLDIVLLLLLALLGDRRAANLIPALHAAAFSSAMLGTVLLNTPMPHRISAALYTGFRSGIGYFLACCIVYAALPVLCSARMPKCVRGWRGVLLYTGVLAMAIACMTDTALE